MGGEAQTAVEAVVSTSGDLVIPAESVRLLARQCQGDKAIRWAAVSLC